MATTLHRNTHYRTSHDELLTRLAEALKLSRQGGFALLSYSNPSESEPWLAALRAKLGKIQLMAIPIPEDGIGLVPQLAELSARAGSTGGEPTVFVIKDIEQLAPSARERLLVNLNLMRTRLAQVPFPLLFCVSDAVLDELILGAPDLLDRIGMWADVRGQAPPIVAPPLRVTSLEQQYLAALVARYNYVDLRTMLPRTGSVRIPLRQVYVLPEVMLVNEGSVSELAQDAVDDVGDSEHLSAPEPRSYSPKPRMIEVTEVIHASKALMVLGSPGSGKSTLLGYLALTSAQSEGAHATLLPERREGWLPLLIQASAFAGSLRTTPDTSLYTFVIDHVEHTFSLRGVRRLIDEALRSGRALLLIDGLDEVDETPRSAVVTDRIDEFIRQWIPHGNHVVVTSRPARYTVAAVVKAASAVVTLCEFSTEQIHAFLRAWYLAYAQFSAGNTFEAEHEARRNAETMIAAIKSNPELRSLAGNPLLLTIMASIQVQRAALPVSRAALYGDLVRGLIEDWNKARGLSRVAFLNLPDPRLTEILLGELALWMQEHAAGAVTAGEALQVLADVQRRLGASSPDAAAAAFLDDARRYVGLFTKRGPDAYSFVHLTFQEYFAARALARLSDAERRWTTLEPHLFDPRWRQTMLLTAAELSETGRTRELGDLVRRMLRSAPAPSKETTDRFRERKWELLTDREVTQLEEQYLQRRLLLAGSLLAETHDVEQGLASKIVDALIKLTRSRIPRQRADSNRVLSTLPAHMQGDLLNRVTADLDNTRSYMRVAATETLGALATTSPDAVNVLIAALGDSDQSVRQAAARGLGAASAGPSTIAALTAALRDAAWTVRLVAAASLGGLAVMQREAAEALSAALSDASKSVRRAAIDSLSSLGLATPEVIQRLLAVLHRGSTSLRRAAADALGSLAKTSPHALEALITALQHDDARIREAAARGLGKSTNRAPEVADILLRTLKDVDGMVCVMAASSLITLGTALPEATAALLAALHHRRALVRRSAARVLGAIDAYRPDAGDALMLALHDSRKTVRQVAAQSLGTLRTPAPAIVEALSATLADADSKVRVAAAVSLATLDRRLPQLVETLIAEFSDPTGASRKYALYGLGIVGMHSSSAYAVVVSALRDPKATIRGIAADALGRFKLVAPEVRLELLTVLGTDEATTVCDIAYAALMQEVTQNMSAI